MASARVRTKRLPRAPQRSDNGSDAQAEPSANGDGDILQRTSLSLAGHPLPPPEAVSKTLARFTELRRLDVSNIKASDDSAHGITDLRWLSKAVALSRSKSRKASGATPLGERLTWLKLADNESLGTHDDVWDVLAQLSALHGVCFARYAGSLQYSMRPAVLCVCGPRAFRRCIRSKRLSSLTMR